MQAKKGAMAAVGAAAMCIAAVSVAAPHWYGSDAANVHAAFSPVTATGLYEIDPDGEHVVISGDMGASFAVPRDWAHQPPDAFEREALDMLVSSAGGVEHYTVESYAAPATLGRVVPASISLEVVRPPEERDRMLDVMAMAGADVRTESVEDGVTGGLPSTTVRHLTVDRNGDMPVVRTIETRVVLNGTLFVLSYSADLADYPWHFHNFRAAERSFSLDLLVDLIVDGARAMSEGAGQVLEISFTAANPNPDPASIVLAEYRVFAGRDMVGAGNIGIAGAPELRAIPGGGSVTVKEYVDVAGESQYWEGASGSMTLVVSGEAHVAPDPEDPDGVVVVPFEQALR